MTEYKIPIRLVSITNAREHWSVRAKRAKLHRISAMVIGKHRLPVEVEIVRHGRKMLDDDNLPPACKSLRDGIADRLGVDDASPLIKWRYSQVTGREYLAVVKITELQSTGKR